MKPLLIAGPTASGKSALALKAAERGRIIVNADASQVYGGWRILTARPSEEEEAEAAHALYGVVDPAIRFSVGDWLRAVRKLIDQHGLDRLIFVGGTGLYFQALTEGLAEIPATPEAVRQAIDRRLREEGVDRLAAQLSQRDPATAKATDLRNPRRVTRALEVLEATGRSLAAWRAETPPPLAPDADRILIEPDREALYARCDARFDAMIAAGALDEALAMAARGLDPEMPAMKAVGAPELFAHLRGDITLQEAVRRAKQATRNYAKRQMTWTRSRGPDWRRVATPDVALEQSPDLFTVQR